MLVRLRRPTGLRHGGGMEGQRDSSFALLACEANAALRAEGRETMPVILPPDPAVQDTWLRGAWDRAKSLIVPYSSSLMEMRVAG
ncbi:hypothetical protein ACFSLT_01815 [Novosphingobium resinovorum]